MGQVVIANQAPVGTNQGDIWIRQSDMAVFLNNGTGFSTQLAELGSAQTWTGTQSIATNGATPDSTVTAALAVKTVFNNPGGTNTLDAIAASQIAFEGIATANITGRGVYADVIANSDGNGSFTDQEIAGGSFFCRTDASSLTTAPRIWGAEAHVSKTSGVADSQMLGLEIGMHKVPAMGAADNIGIGVWSGDLGSITGTTKAGDAIRIYGSSGWTNAIKFLGTNGSVLFEVNGNGQIGVGVGAVSNSNIAGPGGTLTASGSAWDLLLQATRTAAAANDSLYGIQIAGGFNANGHTGVTCYGLHVTGPNSVGANNVGIAVDTNGILLHGEPSAVASTLGLTDTSGFGNGTSATAVTTTTKGTGSGPATPQTVVNYLKVFVGTSTYWVPLVQ